MSPVEIGSVLLPVAVVHWLNLVLPGPNVLLIAHLAAGGHRRAALAAALGMSAMVLTWALVTAIGLAAVLTTPGPLQAALQVTGGAWFCLLARRLWRPTEATTFGPSDTGSAAPPSLADSGHLTGDGAADGRSGAGGDQWRDATRATRAAWLGMATAAANPAATLFYLAVFVGLGPGDADPMLGRLVVGVLVVDSLIWYSALALTLSRPGVCACYLRHRTLLTRACSVLIALMGARLVLMALQTP